MFDSLYQNETDQALRFEAATPRTTPKEKPGVLAGTGTAVVSGLQQGALETGRAGVNAAVAAWRLGGFDRESRGKDLDARLNQPEPELARELGAAARKWDPDPQTMGAAAQVVQQFARVGGKAAGYIMTGGPLAGAAALGVDEGVSEGLKLSDKGVDPATAAQAGAVHGLMTAAGAALPVAGASVAATVGLAAVGGPASFMAEQAAIREILRGADYQGLAAEYDPFDLTGLAVSAGVALTFGAAAQALRAKPKAAPSPLAGAPEEVVDAARVALLDQHDMDVVLGRAKAEGKPVLDALAEQPQGRTEAADRIERGEPIVSRETAAPAQLPEVIDALARQSDEVAPAPAATEAVPPAAKRLQDIEAAAVKNQAPEGFAARLDAMYRAADDALPIFDQAVRAIAAEVNAEPKVAPLKGVPRATEKSVLDYAGDPTRLKDLVRGTIEVRSFADVDQILAGVRRAFGEPIGLRNHLSASSPPVSPDGYRDVKMNVAINGHVAELQVNVPEMLAAKSKAHPLYEEYRSLSGRIESENRAPTAQELVALDDLRDRQKAIYAAAWDEALTNARKAASESSVPLARNEAAGNLRPAGTSQAVATWPKNETGTPSTSANSVPAGKTGSDIASTSTPILPPAEGAAAKAGAAEDPAVVLARQRVAEADFDMRMEDGTVIKASEALRMADDAVRQAETDAGAFQAAVACFLRG